MRKKRKKKYKCLECGRKISHRGKCLACNIKAKKERNIFDMAKRQQRELEKSANETMRTLGLSGSSIKSKKEKKKYTPKYYNEGVDFSDVDPVVGAISIGIAALIIISFFVYKWIQENPTTSLLIGIIILCLLVVGGVFYFRRKKKKKEEKEKYEKEQISKGLIKFIDRFGTERWGKPKEVKKWTKEDKEAKEKEKLINQVINEIDSYIPSRKHKFELPYQSELYGFLKAKFSNIDIEKQKGSSRPDIVVEDVAIEIKGPTRHKDLDTIASKCMRYYKHFSELVIVLFDVQVNERYYNEWYERLIDTFPKVRVIKK